MKSIIGLCFLTFALVGCGGGGGSSGSDGDSSDESDNELSGSTSDCVVNENVIQLAIGETCVLSDQVASTYSLTAGNVSCSQTAITYGGSEFSAGDDLTLNGLTFVCGS